jgi:hypothetical protein
MGTLEVSVRSEAKGLIGGPPDSRLTEPVPYEIDPTVSVAVEDGRKYALRLGYSSRILFLAAPGNSYAAHYGTGSANGSWRANDRLKLDLGGSLSRGMVETTPTAQLPASTTPGSEPSLQTAPVVGTAHQHAESVDAGASYQLSHGTNARLAAGYARAGGANSIARQLIPEQESQRVEAALATGVSERDTLTFRTAYRRTAVIFFGTGDILDARARWDRRIAPGVGTYLGAGAAVTVRSTLAGDVRPASFLGRVSPEVEAGIGTPVGRPDLSANIGVAFAPTVDPYTRRVENKASVRADLDWVAAKRLRINARLLGASVLRDFLPRGGSAASELVFWFRAPDLEIGVGSRAGYNEALGAQYWQWSFFFSARAVSKSSI